MNDKITFTKIITTAALGIITGGLMYVLFFDYCSTFILKNPEKKELLYIFPLMFGCVLVSIVAYYWKYLYPAFKNGTASTEWAIENYFKFMIRNGEKIVILLFWLLLCCIPIVLISLCLPGNPLAKPAAKTEPYVTYFWIIYTLVCSYLYFLWVYPHLKNQINKFHRSMRVDYSPPSDKREW